MHESIARKIGLTGTDHKYLGFIMQKGEMTAGDLAQSTGLTTGAITGIIDRLEKKKLVTRSFSDEDRRKVLIVPNHKKIKSLLDPIFNKLQARTDRLISSFTEGELKVIHRYFHSAIQIMENTTRELKEGS
jgi:DNA-binding MarR family transcriptional regulator